MNSKYIELLRIKHWIKNSFIFIPLFFSGNLFNYLMIYNLLIIVIGFSLICSSVYIINDLFDIEFDKMHPTKRFRPIAAGEVSKRQSNIISATLILAGLIIISSISVNAAFLALIYFFVNLLYSSYLKRIPILDIFIIAIGFVIRIMIGGLSSNILISKWMIILIFLLSLFIAISKRRDDVLQYKKYSKINRDVVKHYNLDFINFCLSSVAGVFLVSYLMFIVQDSTILKFKSNFLFITFIFVLMGVLRLAQISFVYEKSGSPVQIILDDKFIQVTLLFWIFSFLIILYM